MKLALIALAIEISLARLLTSSWIWAVVVVFVYCTLVYARMSYKAALEKKQNGNKFVGEPDSFIAQDNIYVNRNNKNQLFDMAGNLEVFQKN